MTTPYSEHWSAFLLFVTQCFNMSEEFFNSYADNKQLKKLKTADISKQERAWILTHDTGVKWQPQSAIKLFFKEFYPDYFNHYSYEYLI